MDEVEEGRGSYIDIVLSIDPHATVPFWDVERDRIDLSVGPAWILAQILRHGEVHARISDESSTILFSQTSLVILGREAEKGKIGVEDEIKLTLITTLAPVSTSHPLKLPSHPPL